MKKPAIFLDRDGTLIYNISSLKNIKQIRLLPNASKAIKKFHSLGFFVFIVTNQGAVARGHIKESDVDFVHDVIQKRLKKNSTFIDAFYYCPHHPTDAKKKEYALICNCRKPNIGLILQAANEFEIDFKKSFFIGDMTTDILTGKNAGIKTVLVKTGSSGKDGRCGDIPDYVAENLLDSVSYVQKFL